MENTIKRPMFILGTSFFAVGLACSLPGIWIPGLVFLVIAISQKPKS